MNSRLSGVTVLSILFFGGLSLFLFILGIPLVALLFLLFIAIIVAFDVHTKSGSSSQSNQYIQPKQYIQPNQYSQPYNNFPQYQQPVRQLIACKRCGSPNVTITLNSYQTSMHGKNEVRKKTFAKRMSQTTNRTIANVATLGAWGLFTKKPSKYQETSRTYFSTVTEKIAICQSCGKSWKINT